MKDNIADILADERKRAGEAKLEQELAEAQALNAKMLEALERLLNLTEHPYFEQPSPKDLPAWEIARDAARTAIAKAKE